MKDYYDKIEEVLVESGYEVFNKESSENYYWFSNDDEPVDLKFDLIGSVWVFYYKTSKAELEDLEEGEIEATEIDDVRTMSTNDLYEELVNKKKSVLDIAIE